MIFNSFLSEGEKAGLGWPFCYYIAIRLVIGFLSDGNAHYALTRDNVAKGCSLKCIGGSLCNQAEITLKHIAVNYPMRK